MMVFSAIPQGWAWAGHSSRSVIAPEGLLMRHPRVPDRVFLRSPPSPGRLGAAPGVVQRGHTGQAVGEPAAVFRP